MDSIWVVLLDILKITIPAFIVYMTAYHLLRRYLDHQTQQRVIDQRTTTKEATMQLRLQAYERLVLFLERISVPNLLMRIAPGVQSSTALKMSLLTAIQQEYEHNLSQQIYVSENLWTIVQLARQDIANLISNVHDTLPETSTKEDYVHVLLEMDSNRAEHPILKAKQAVRQEAGLQL